MICLRPAIGAYGVEFGCGRCLACRINNARVWQARLILENQLHPYSIFATFTYSNDNLPSGNTLVPEDMSKYFKRLRKAIGKFRYYYVGEYGEQTKRPHYHALLFGDFSGNRTDLVRKCWTQRYSRVPIGHVHIGDVNNKSIAYCTGYITKGMTRDTDARLDGRHPEFSRMSRSPGIGAHALDRYVSELTTRKGAAALSQMGDIPSEIRIDGKSYPLGRYLVTKARDAVGMAPGLPTRKAIENQVRRETDKNRPVRRQNLAHTLRVREEIKTSKRIKA